MERGDFIITPSWTWHDHGNPAGEPVIWLDGLDIPLIRSLDAGFAENFPGEEQPVTSPEGQSLTRFGNNMVPIGYEPTSLTSPIFAYPYAQSRATLHALAKRTGPDRAHGYKMQFINPVTGGYAMPTMATFMQLLPRDFATAPYRSTDGAVYSVVEGRGEVSIGEGDQAKTFEFTAKDHFVVPSWQPHRFRAADECVLFSFSDRPVQKALGLWREQRS
jgi:gentisate 1,2-dioxygenase